MPLTDTQIRTIKPEIRPVKHSDGGGLHLLVSPSGSKLWRLAYRFGGKQKTLALGVYPHVTLSKARERREEVKAVLATGIDPAQLAKEEKAKKQAVASNTFSAVADELLAKMEREGRADATLAKTRWLMDMAKDALGSRPIAEISAAEILVPLRKVEAKGNLETARRLRALIGQVFRYAIATARTDNDPTFGLRGALTTPKVIHRPAITEAKAFGRLLKAIADYDGAAQTRIALQLMALLYPRPGELRQAEWSEFDLEAGVWTIPATRAKMRREHKKPLPKQAVILLRELRSITGNGRLAFPAQTSMHRPLSENTLNAALRRMGFTKEQASAHGFRASASTLLNESGKWLPDAIEAELGHVESNAVRRAYHRAQYWDERVRMQAWWAAVIESLARNK